LTDSEIPRNRLTKRAVMPSRDWGCSWWGGSTALIPTWLDCRFVKSLNSS
jgi:hypothetical protein